MKNILALFILVVFSYMATNAQTAAGLTYQITDVAGKDIATGELKNNTSLAINVAVGTYTVHLTGDKNYEAVKNVVVDETEEISASNHVPNGTLSSANIKNVSTGYIVVKIDNNGAFSCKKLLL